MATLTTPSTHSTPTPILDTTEILPSFRMDLRRGAPDMFVDLSATDWSSLSWKDLGSPYQVNSMSRHRKAWEAEHDEEMAVQTQWTFFNHYFHEMFATNVPERRQELQGELLRKLGTLNIKGAARAIHQLAQVLLWNKAHRIEDAIWDPRGKRALFADLEVQNPQILFLGAAEGYEAMQLLAMYGGHAVLVDYDPFCKAVRYGEFPEAYPFLGTDHSTGQPKVFRRTDFDIEYVVEDIRNLNYGKVFDIVVSIGLIEHFPDDYKPLAIDFHRRFLKPGGYAIFTTPRVQFLSKVFYTVMGEIMNFGYRELMNTEQLGLYVYENGFDILRAGTIKAHNGIIAKVR